MLFQLKKRSRTIPSSEITPEHIYLSRRQFMAGAAVLTASTALAACAAPSTEGVETAVPPTL
ncbi:MAG: twin-arginine translocation signal domain-containing protein, partial [Chloroflexi bacterium]|nr:twin-arginine translocation signal domain-containing protein [Chloroflexota bacterium]